MQIIDGDTVLASAEFIHENAVDVSIDLDKVDEVAMTIAEASQNRQIPKWGDHELNPQNKSLETLNWYIITFRDGQT